MSVFTNNCILKQQYSETFDPSVLYRAERRSGVTRMLDDHTYSQIFFASDRNVIET